MIVAAENVEQESTQARELSSVDSNCLTGESDQPAPTAERIGPASKLRLAG